MTKEDIEKMTFDEFIAEFSDVKFTFTSHGKMYHLFQIFEDNEINAVSVYFSPNRTKRINRNMTLNEIYSKTYKKNSIVFVHGDNEIIEFKED